LQCSLVTDGGGALILVPAERARDFPESLPLAVNRGPVYLPDTGESVETPMVTSPVIPAKERVKDFRHRRFSRHPGENRGPSLRLTNLPDPVKVLPLLKTPEHLKDGSRLLPGRGNIR